MTLPPPRPSTPEKDDALRQALAANVRAARERLGLSQEELARAAGWDVADVVAVETRWGRGMTAVWELCAPLHVAAHDLFGFAPARDDAALAALGRVPVGWWADPTLGGALRALADWYGFDATLTLVATPSRGGSATSVAGLGVPAALASALPRTPMPLPDLSAVAEEEPFAAEAARGARVAAALRAGAGLAERAAVTVADLAAAYAVPVGHRPLPDLVRAVAGYADRRPLLVLSTERAEDVVTPAAMHLLVHLLCGDVTLAAVDVIRTRRSDSVESCHGVGVQACIRAGHVAARLLRGDDAVEDEDRAWAAGDRPWLTDPDPGPGVRLAGPALPQEVAPAPDGRKHWFEYEVDVDWREVEDLVDRPHPLLAGRGTGESVMPAALAWRHLQVVAAGRRGLDRADELGLDRPGHPRGRDLREAEHAYRTVEAQLSAWNEDGVARAFR